MESDETYEFEEPSFKAVIDKKIQVRECPECGGTSLMRDYEAAEIVCTSCGFVVAEKIADTKPEWRAFDEEQRAKRTRAGAPLTYMMHDMGLSTIIDWRDGQSLSRRVTAQQQEELYKLRKWQMRTRVSDSIERNLSIALSELMKVGSSLNLPKSIVENASIMYRQALKKGLVKGRSISAMVAAAIYLSCRQCGVARTLDELSSISGVSRKDIGRSYRYIIKELGAYMPPTQCASYTARLSNKLSLSARAEALAIKILEMARRLRLTSGRGPTGVAAASTYVASVLMNERKTQREIAEVANVTEVTIRNRYRELLEKILFEVPL